MTLTIIKIIIVPMFPYELETIAIKAFKKLEQVDSNQHFHQAKCHEDKVSRRSEIDRPVYRRY